MDKNSAVKTSISISLRKDASKGEKGTAESLV